MSATKTTRKPATKRTAAVQKATLQTLPTSKLILGANVRDVTALDPEHNPDDADLIASIRDLGILQPIVGIQTADGVVVRQGQRRTLAALAIGQDDVQVVVLPEGSSGDDVDRIVRQLAENDHRANVRETDRLAAYEQLAGFGMSAEQIAGKTRRDVREIDAALVTVKSKVATKAATENPGMSLLDAALIAEFDDDPETQQEILEAVEDGDARYVAQRARDDKARDAADKDAQEHADAEGVTVVSEWQAVGYGRPGKALSELRGAIEGQAMDPASHTACPGHAAYIAHKRDENGGIAGELVYVCTDARANKHKKLQADSDGDQPQRTPMTEEEKAERRRVIENNKAWEATGPVRAEWLDSFAGGKTAPKNAEKFLAVALAHGDRIESANGWSPEGKKRIATATKAGPKTALRFAIHQLLIDWHDQVSRESARDHWRHAGDRTRRYLAAMTEWGYTPSPIEREAAGLPKTAKAKASA